MNIIRTFKIIIKNIIETFIKTFIEIKKDLIKEMNFNVMLE